MLADQEADIDLDRVHRALGPRPTDPSRPRDVVCRFHCYLQKENVLRRAWEHGDVEMAGTHMRILPDLSRATLRPILELAKPQGLKYHWGYPLAVSFRKDASAFTLQTAADLLALFCFLEADPILVPDWLQILPRPTGRSGLTTFQGPLPPRHCRQQRGRRRHRTVSRGERCE